MTLPKSELIVNANGSVYHLNLLPEDIADTIILVGDPDRVQEVSKHFDSIELQKGKREFLTHTGLLNNQRLTVLSTGIGTDNIDIVWNELNVLANFDLQTKQKKERHKILNVIRIGTSGSLQMDVPVDSILVSSFGLGFDVLMHYYNYSKDTETQQLEAAFQNALAIPFLLPYLVKAPGYLIDQFSDCIQGITATCSGFYAPQGRIVNAKPTVERFIERLASVKIGDKRITNFEMETAGIYGLANTFGHNAVSVNAIIANRVTQQFSKDGQSLMENTIAYVLEKITK